jgi:hypothetical protein
VQKPHLWSEHVVCPVVLMQLERDSQIAYKVDGILELKQNNLVKFHQVV